MSRKDNKNAEASLFSIKFADTQQSIKDVGRRPNYKSSSFKIEQHTIIFASMCPDEILDNYDDYDTRSYYTTLMLGDVSGFTDLTEKCTKSGKGGPSKLTEILNTYIGSMVQEILSHRGDVLKFSGDAFIVMWKLQEGMVMRDIAIEAMQTACIIQKHFGTYETDVGVILKVKLAIAAGKTSFTSIGNPKWSSHYIITGKPVWDLKYAEGLCKGGDIIVAQSCWQWVNPNEYIYEKLPDGIHTLIIASSVLYDTNTKESFENLVTESSQNEEIAGWSRSFSRIANKLIENKNGDLFQQVDYNLRPKVIKAAKARLKNALRSYTLRPVVRSVELNEPIEYLTEMRQVVIVFVNVITQDLDKRRLIRLVNYAYNLVCGIVGEMQGCVNKTSLFDKDLMFLCIFGLRGDKHELESQIGLRCAAIIRKKLTTFKNIRSVSVGVTTGITYCGVVGHILRREYTVIGLPVNKAARLMCAYTDKVVCDRASFLQSHLEARHFVLQETKYLKGITNVGPVYEFLEQTQHNGSELIVSKYPILGRDSELTIFENLLKTMIKTRSERQWDKNVRPEQSVLIIRGIPRIGKTRLMDEFTQLVPSSMSLNFISLISSDGQIIDLLGVKKWFQAGLVCQFLNCQAIPAELEKMIQKKSMGNPGWIESYLISVEQSEGLLLQNVSREQIISLGLVVPPREMLIRANLTKTSQELSNKINRLESWRMYSYTFKESDLEVEKIKLSISSDHEDAITICVLTEKFGSEDLENEVTMDVIIMKLFDSLNPLDQFLLKCAAVLGEAVDRKMLESLMQGISQRKISVTVTKLFEMRLLGCAVGDFNRSPGSLIFFRNLPSSNIGIEVRCGCVGVQTKESLADLPTYASCQLMHFKITMFRETTYRLLTENQKVELHNKALKYLQKTTRRCLSCGEGQFVKLLGETMVEEKIRGKTWDAIDNVSDTYFFNNAGIFHEADERSSSVPGELTCLDLCKSVNQVPTRSFSQADFSNCQCNMILLTVYTQMVDHFRGIGIKDKLLTAILEFTDVCISSCNIPQARKLLTESESILEEMLGTTEDELITLPYLKGKIYTLRGRCFLESGLVNEAETCFNLAAKAMGYDFPKSKLIIKIKSAIMLKRLNQMLTWCRPCKVGIMRGMDADYVDQFAKCLAQIFIIFRIKRMHGHAHFAAIWSLCVALESSKDFFALCTAYANMMITAHILQLRKIIAYLENDGIRICSQRKKTFELEELKAVGELYSVIFFSRWLQGMTLKASSIGFVANRIASTIHATTLQLIILPRLIHLMLVNSRHDEAIYLLQEMEIISNDDMDKSGRTWYYALCIDLLLDAGITIIPFYKCEQFYQEESDTMSNLRDPEAERRFFVCMWLWYVRVGDWETATVWKNRKANVDIVMDAHTVAAAITILKRVEGLLILYVHKVDSRNVEAAAETRTEIREQLKIIKKLQKVVKVVSCRYSLMKAYYCMVRFHTKRAFKFLNKTKKLSQKFQIRMMYRWADHNEKAWTGSLNDIQRDFWSNQHSPGSIIDWHKIASNKMEILPYTLPLPKSMQ